jgi:hypothetical protein
MADGGSEGYDAFETFCSFLMDAILESRGSGEILFWLWSIDTLEARSTLYVLASLSSMKLTTIFLLPNKSPARSELIIRICTALNDDFPTANRSSVSCDRHTYAGRAGLPLLHSRQPSTRSFSTINDEVTRRG